jgi:hypothetical protein
MCGGEGDMKWSWESWGNDKQGKKWQGDGKGRGGEADGARQ